jgi:hypothetical protein
MNWLKAFAAGFLGTLVFHQGLMGLLYLAGVSPRAPFPMAATEPLGIPQVVSLAFWGGVWAMALWPLLRRRTGGAGLAAWTIAGALGPSAVALFVVFPLKGLGMAGGWDPKIIVGALLLNAAWGLGTALFLRALKAR